MFDLYAEAKDLFEFTQGVRRDLHRHPELGFREFRTAGIVAQELGKLGMEVTTGVAETGVVGLLEGGRPGPVVLVRFDMDALPVSEETGAEYASQTPGVMHACGHDGHVAVGLTVARLLNAHRSELSGSVKFVFQPAEEGLGGAKKMVEAGVLNSPHPAHSLALHVWNEKPVGWVGIVPGPLMAGAAFFSVKITGKGGHGAMPQQTIDPVVAAAQVVTGLQTVVARNVPPTDSAVVSVTYIKAGETFNVIPSTAELRGTLRYYEAEVRDLIFRRFKELTEGIAASFGCETQIEINDLTPAVINDAGLAKRLAEAAAGIIPGMNLITSYRTTVSEDMSEMMQNIPGCYMLVGSANAGRGLNYGHHHPKFDIDEGALINASALMAGSVLELLSGS